MRLTEAIRAMCAEKKPFVLVSIAEASGSMPRHKGSTMLVRADGSIEGSVGGGLLEAQAIRRAVQAIAEGKDCDLPFNLSSADAANSEMICGGTGTLALRYFTGTDETALAQELRTIDDGRMVIFGGGHISLQLARVAELLDIPVVVIEDRAEFCTAERFPRAVRIVVDSYDRIPPLPLGAKDMAVIVTRGHLGDRGSLTWALGTDAGYIGMIGSVRKRDLMYDKMLADGLDAAQLQRVHSPIGLPIGAQTPEEIAISIAAELVSFRNPQK